MAKKKILDEVCKGCGQSNVEYYMKNDKVRSGAYCVKCHNKRNMERYNSGLKIQRKMDNLKKKAVGKQCPRCYQYGVEFYKYGEDRKLSVYCKKCTLELQRENYANNPEFKKKVVERSREYLANNREKNKIQCIEYYNNHKEEAKEASRKWSRENKEKERLLKKEWAKNNPERRKAISKKHASTEKGKFSARMGQYRRKLRMKNKGSFTLEEWDQLKQSFYNLCLKCGKSEVEVKLFADHVVPISKGGLNIISNIQPLCNSCNIRKSSKIEDYRHRDKRVILRAMGV